MRPHGVLLCWPGGGAMWSVCSHASCPPDAVCPGLHGARGASASPLYPDSFRGVLFLNIIHCSCEGEWGQE